MLDREWEQLLYLYDYHIRAVYDSQNDNSDRDDHYYNCGYADAIGQVILDLAKIENQDIKPKSQRSEAYKRVMAFTNATKYIQDYPVKIERQPINI